MCNGNEQHSVLPNYYTVTPASVRYDPELTDFQIKLYGEIICHTQSQGFCWATNQYFADIYNKIRNNKKPLSKRTIRVAISNLEERGHLYVVQTCCPNCKTKERKIYPDSSVPTPPWQYCHRCAAKKSLEPSKDANMVSRKADNSIRGKRIILSAADNSIPRGGDNSIPPYNNINIKYNNINTMSSNNLTLPKANNFKPYEEMTPKEALEFDTSAIDKKNKKALNMGASNILDFLNYKTGSAFRCIETNIGLIISILKSGVTVADVRMVITTKHNEWGNDPKMAQYLRPATLFRKRNFEQYYGEYLGKIKQIKREGAYYE
jgi:uncharacterized phage protein (TIGR02220 family)